MTDEPKTAGKIILAELAAMEKRLNARIDALRGAVPAGGAANGVASDRDLDSEWGNEEVRKDPKRWKGESFAGKRMNECPPEFLDELAGHFDYKSEREAEDAATTDDEQVAKDKKKYSGYSRKSAARARGWAARLRAGWKPAAADAGENHEGW